MSHIAPLGVIVTRPPPGLDKTKKALQIRGWRPVCSPAMKIESCAGEAPSIEADGIVVTSGYAVTCLKQFRKDIPIYCVGDVTAQKVQKLGFAHVMSAHADGARLAEKLIATRKLLGKKLLFPCGVARGGELADKLRQGGINIYQWYVYKASPSHEPSYDIVRQIMRGQIYATLFFSSKTAQYWLGQLVARNIKMTTISQMKYVVISKKVARIVKDIMPYSEIIAASEMTHEGVMDKLGDYAPNLPTLAH